MPEFEPATTVIAGDNVRPGDTISFGTAHRSPPVRIHVIAIVAVLAAVMVGDYPLDAPGSLSPGGVPYGWEVPPDVPHPAPVAGRPTVKFPPPTLNLPGVVVEFDQGNQGYLAVTAQRCTAARECQVTLATSSRPGRWSTAAIPKDATRNGGSPRLRVLDAGVLLLENYGEQTPGGWHSADGGRTWRAVPYLRRPPLPAAAGRRLDLKRVGLPAGPCDGRQVAAYMRSSGELVPLRNQPRLRACAASPFPDRYGRRWVAGTAAGGAAVAMSRDEGRTWSRSLLPGTRAARYVEVAVTGRHAYAVVFGNPTGGVRLSVTGVFRHDRTGWSMVWRPDITQAWVGQMTVCPQGLLVVPAGHPESANDRATVRWTGRTGLPTVLATAVPGQGWIGWYLDRASVRPVRSYDCRTWHGLTVT